MLAAIGYILIGLAALVAGGELLVRGASRIAALLGISPLVIGLTVVAFGTSSPELAVSLKASLGGQADIAVGNVVGSNIFNVLFILGISALIAPLVVSSQLVRLDVPLMIAVSVLVLFMGLDGNLNRVEGIILFAGLIAYTWWLIYQSRKESAAVRAEYEREFGEKNDKKTTSLAVILLQAGFIIGGLVFLSFGAGWLVEGAVRIARHFGMSELLIGLTIVAAGTSLPEVAASVLAAIRGERDIAVGNVVGSNIFNLMCVLGLSAVIAPGGVPIAETALRLDIPIMIAVAFACLPIFFTGHLIARWEGGLFLGYYIAYIVYLILLSTNDGASRMMETAMLGFILPLTAITLLVGAIRSLRDGGNAPV